MKINYILLIIFSAIFANLPADRVSIKGEQELIEMAHRLKPSQTVWLLLPLAESFETQVIQELAKKSRWRTLRSWHPLTFDEYHALVFRLGLTILHHEPQRTYLKGPQLRHWLEAELAPRLGLASEDYKLFADEFLTLYGHDTAIRKELLTQLSHQHVL